MIKFFIGILLGIGITFLAGALAIRSGGSIPDSIAIVTDGKLHYPLPPVKATPPTGWAYSDLAGKPYTDSYAVTAQGALLLSCDCLKHPPKDIFTIGDLRVKCATKVPK